MTATQHFIRYTKIPRVFGLLPPALLLAVSGAPPRAGRRFWHAECTSNEEYGCECECELRRPYRQIKGVEREGQRLWATTSSNFVL